MNYIVKKIPRGGNGFTYSQLEFIADTIIREVNKDDANLMLNKKHKKNIITYVKGYTTGRSYPVVESEYAEYARAWRKKNITIQIGNFKMEVKRSPYAIRGLLRKLGIKIEEV